MSIRLSYADEGKMKKYYLLTIGHDETIWTDFKKTKAGIKKELKEFLIFHRFIEEQNVIPDYESIEELLSYIDKDLFANEIISNGNGLLFQWGKIT